MCRWALAGLLSCGIGWGTAEERTTASEGKPAASETGVRGSYGDELAGATGDGARAISSGSALTRGEQKGVV